MVEKFISVNAKKLRVCHKKLSGFADVGEELPNAYRETRVLVEPIIESGSVTWLFAAEKVGKTWLGLSIAYAAAKGHRPVGAWKVESPCRVLYIDGEMPGHKLTDMIKKIMNGYEDNGERPFVFYSFFEEDLDYDSILDEEWQKKGNPLIADHDLVILDNYYSLNENRLNIKPFLRWLKAHSRKGVAFLVLDHTNAAGEPQGSAIKKRAADLGIIMERESQNQISVAYPFDRYGVESKSPSHTLIPCFTASEFKFERSLETTKYLEPKKLNDKLALYAYLLALKAQGKSAAEIASHIGMNRNTVDNYLNAFKPENELSDAQKEKRSKITPEDKELVHEEQARLMQLTEVELDQMLEYFQDSRLSVIQRRGKISK